MVSYMKTESQVGQMLRYISGDIGMAFKKDLQKLYDYETEDEREIEVAEDCANWHWMVVKYAPDVSMTRKFISIIQYCYEFKIKPSDLKSWKKLMRIYLPEQFLLKMAKFTQVPQLAIMDEGHEERMKGMKKEMRDAGEIDW